ncbi:sensor histidine kinase [Candidatus Paracaedibacter symbiosus]|uniref:sensor histidine kinase n=1 Tax=Candidatus Paracaedibacter symbiosus TaxID=244582 RepID=UPI0005093CB3|nr:HAMP domain-containing sensor histidine kinase [Candidatus Paracaedibacter symbiosus]
MNLGKRFLEFLDRRIEGFGGAQYKNFGIFGIINYPVSYFILNILGTDESAIFRFSAALMCFPLIFVKKWPIQLKRYLNLYWFLTLLYCLPIFGIYSLLKNQISIDWLINISIGLFILFLIVDYILLIIIYVLGILLGYLLFISTGQEVIFQQGFPPNFIYIYGALFIIGCLFSRNKERLENERFQTIKAVAGAVAHEMRTPLLSIATIAYGLKRYLPILIKAYKSAKNEGSDIEKIEQHQLEFISQIPESIEKTNRNAFSFIDILLMNFKEDFKETPTTVCSMQQCLEEAIKYYPFSGNDRKLVSYITHEDFKFRGNDLLIRHVLFNLLKNSIYYVRAANKGNITLTPRVEKDFNKLYVRDTGKGISSHVLPHIFDKFYSKTKYGTGIGLAFCKMVMENLGGNIICHSKEGEFTEFVLSFPIINEH